MKAKPQQHEQLGLLGLGSTYPTPASTPPSRPGRPPRPPAPPVELPPRPSAPRPAQAMIRVRVICSSVGHPELGVLELPADFSPADFSRRASQAWGRPSGAPFEMKSGACPGWTLIVPSAGLPCACPRGSGLSLDKARKALEAPADGEGSR